jgi:hypothetical protein
MIKKITRYLLFIMSISALIVGAQDNAARVLRMQNRADATWAVVGAGPAGIAVVGILIDLGVNPRLIHWIDPKFNVGRLGEYYYHVPGNAKTAEYIAFVNECNFFKVCSTEALERLRSHDPQDRCTLSLVIDALRDLTTYLHTHISSHKKNIDSFTFGKNNEWIMHCSDGSTITAHNVVLATGGTPRSLAYSCKQEIPLDFALDKKQLEVLVEPEDTIAVVGGSHSAVLVLKHLHELKVKRVLNFFQSPLCYAEDMGEGNPIIAFGLKGVTGRWAYDVLEKGKAGTIARIYNSEESRRVWLPLCNKIIYAVGYERTEIPLIGYDSAHLTYDGTTGIVMPQLFGMGMAFPEEVTTETGESYQLIGIADFMEYAQRVIPEWLKKSHSIAAKRIDTLFRLFIICADQ